MNLKENISINMTHAGGNLAQFSVIRDKKVKLYLNSRIGHNFWTRNHLYDTTNIILLVYENH